MFNVNEAIKEIKRLRCKTRYTKNEILSYHKCLNIIEEELCNGTCIVIDPSTFNSDSPEECYDAIQKAKDSLQ